MDAETIVIMAPIGADSANIAAVLRRAGLPSRVCKHEVDLQAALAGDYGAVVLTEEALVPSVQTTLTTVFAAQPPWSDIPIVLIGVGGMSNSGAVAAAKLRGPRRTVTLLERPLRATTLMATIHTVLSARRRQYEIRDLLRERDLLLSSLESRVAERTADLQLMVQEMEAFSYSVSHDLRSPLRSLHGYARALEEDFGEHIPAGAKVYLEKIARAARRMDNLTQDILAYTRATRCEMEITTVDLDTLFTEVIEQYPALGASAHRIKLRKPLGRVLGHVPSLIQCFSNLLGNALKFVPEDREPEIEVFSRPNGSHVRVSVKDNGIGIHPSHHVRIFGMFERAAQKEFAGTGIGLAIVKKAAERMGGAVGVISTPGNGAEFWVDLRVAPVPAPAPAPASTPGATTADASAGLAKIAASYSPREAREVCARATSP
jgi:signal transduction histidine kinase